MMEALRLEPASLAEEARCADAGVPSTTDVAPAFRELMEGRAVLVAILQAPGRRLIVLGSPDEGIGLRARQNAVVALLCAGRSMKQVAMELGRAMATASKHLNNALAILGVASPIVLVHTLAPLAASLRGVQPSGARVSELVHEGRRYRVLGVDHDAAPRPQTTLTTAEREVVELVRRGYSNRAIARARRRSPRTIANQLARTFGKLGVHSRVELVLALPLQRAESA